MHLSLSLSLWKSRPPGRRLAPAAASGRRLRSPRLRSRGEWPLVFPGVRLSRVLALSRGCVRGSCLSFDGAAVGVRLREGVAL
jgi:hypothetical protein